MTEPELSLIVEGSRELEELKARRRTLSSDLYADLESSKAAFDRIEDLEQSQVEGELSKLDQGLQEAKECRETLADLAAGMAGSLEQYTEVAKANANFRGMEKVLNTVKIFGAEKHAERLRTRRLLQQSPEENLEQVLDFSVSLRREILQRREIGVARYESLQANVDVITKKIAEYQPQEAALKEQLDAMEEDFSVLEAEYETSDAARQAELTETMNERRQKLTTVRNKYDQVLTVYNIAQQTLQPNVEARNAYEQIVRDLGRQATMIEAKVDDVTDMYAAAPDAVKIMMTTKGTEIVDKGLNKATEQVVNIITQSSVSVNDATLAREEIQIIAAEVMYTFKERMRVMDEEFHLRQEGISDQARQSQQDRYTAPAE